jgi:hypothetical protein
MEKILENFATSISESVEGDEWTKRFCVSLACGYMDAKHMVYMSQTFGYPLWAYIDKMKEKVPGIKVPWDMLEHELLCIGKSKSSILSLFVEIKA